jgi:hypothetical protein
MPVSRAFLYTSQLNNETTRSSEVKDPRSPFRDITKCFLLNFKAHLTKARVPSYPAVIHTHIYVTLRGLVALVQKNSKIYILDFARVTNFHSRQQSRRYLQIFSRLQSKILVQISIVLPITIVRENS